MSTSEYFPLSGSGERLEENLSTALWKKKTMRKLFVTPAVFDRTHCIYLVFSVPRILRCLAGIDRGC